MSKQNYVFVLDTNRRPLNPCAPGVAREGRSIRALEDKVKPVDLSTNASPLLKAGKARVFRSSPFTIILNKAVDTPTQPVQLKLDPGSRTTGIALVQDKQVIWGGELTHRGQQIKEGRSICA